MVKLINELGKRRNIVVALDHGRHRPEMGGGGHGHLGTGFLGELHSSSPLA
jgi:hypothetical protein